MLQEQNKCLKLKKSLINGIGEVLDGDGNQSMIVDEKAEENKNGVDSEKFT
jgi:hypothetical protein